ncbi:hypothetical protein [Polyangium sp. 6x1]|nr:hypothetical protein [Polyangium sp. 6x1]MDI1444352.1 hypothetical protein [Polyangium sp. 6x1]
MKTKSKVATKKAGKKAKVNKALIESLVKRDLESLASGSPALCGLACCW